MSSKEIPSSSPDQKTAGGEENSYFKHYIFVRLFAEHIKLEITFLFQNGCWLLFTSIGASWLELGVFAELEIGSLKGEPSLTHCSEVVVKLQSPVSAANLEIRTQLQARCLKIYFCSYSSPFLHKTESPAITYSFLNKNLNFLQLIFPWWCA